MLKKRFLKRAAFTLVEVLVVTTIMAGQTNNYGQVKRIAYQKTCENNLRQLYMGLQMYEMSYGSLPAAKLYPKNPKRDKKSIVKLMDPAYEPLFVCPVFPSAIKDKGLTYIYNDEIAGQSLDMLPTDTWIMMEMNAVSEKIPLPHPGGFHILYANGQIKIQKELPKVFADLQDKLNEKLQEKDKKKESGGSNEEKKPETPKESD